jgi:hypothetical protein
MTGQKDTIPLLLLSALSALLIGGFLLLFIGQKPQEQQDDRVKLKAIKAQLSKAEELRSLWNKATRDKDESKRIQYIQKTKKAYERVIAQVEALRVKPYVQKDTEEFKEGYVYLEQFEAQAGQTLHDIVRRSKVGDFDKPNTK